jgi:hypothetical protein
LAAPGTTLPVCAPPTKPEMIGKFAAAGAILVAYLSWPFC